MTRRRQPLRRVDFFDEIYRGAAPWDIGRPQREIVALEEAGAIAGAVLDAGCGTGENALYLASRGHEVVGVDAAPRAIAEARRRARERGLPAVFVTGDVLDLGALGRTFDAVVDSGLFHPLSDPERPRFAASLARALRPGGTYSMLAFSDLEPGDFPLPRRVSPDEIRATFAHGWRVDRIRPGIFESRVRPGGSRAWVSSITRI